MGRDNVNRPPTLVGLPGLEQFARRLGLGSRWLTGAKQRLARSHMPFRVSEHFVRILDRAEGDAKERLVNMVVPPPIEAGFQGRFDPYGNRRFSVPTSSVMQSKYAETLLFHLRDFCASNCQFCYKVGEIRVSPLDKPSFRASLEFAAEELRARPKVDNVLVTGGDPLSALPAVRLVELMEFFSGIPQVRTIRLATKALSYDPSRFGATELLEYLDGRGPDDPRITIVAQINHPSEISPEAERSIALLRRKGVSFRGQPVLLRGVNDDEQVLVDLFQAFGSLGVEPYYLVTFMPVKGVEQYAVPLATAFALAESAKQRLNGLEKKFVLIAPNDFGKAEICGFLPSSRQPKRILLKWHQRVHEEHVAESVDQVFPTGEVASLKYHAGMTCLDHVIGFNVPAAGQTGIG